MLWLLLLASLLLSGCVQYDVGVTFKSQTKGEIVQHIQLAEQLTGLSGSVAQEWLTGLKRRARKLQGKVRQASKRELMVTIPFNNSADLADKFNQLFNAENEEKAAKASAAPDLPKVDSRFEVSEKNFLFAVRDRIQYDLDLQSLGVLSSEGELLLAPGSLLRLEFALKTPWGARGIATAANAITPESRNSGHTLIWALQPGEVNRIEAVFWLPSSVGLGAAAILVAIIVGQYLRYQLLPRLGLLPQPASPVPVAESASEPELATVAEASVKTAEQTESVAIEEAAEQTESTETSSPAS